jgi:tetratricopeptide (TPR) repeat protein
MQRQKRLLLFSAFACVPVAIALYLLFDTHPPIEKLLFDADVAFEQKKFAEAEALAVKVLAREDSHPQALLIAGMAAEELDRPQDAVSWFARITDEDEAVLADALQRSAGLLFHKLGRLSEAERDQQRLVDLRPTPKTFSDLAYLQVLSGRSRQASGPLLQLVKWNQCSIEQLCWLGIPELVTEAPGTLERCRKLAPDDPFTQLGLAFLLQYRGQHAMAEDLARTIVSQHPDLLEAHLVLGNLIVDTAPDEEFRVWQRSMPDPEGNHPDTWSIRGRLALLQNNRSAAIRCFLEAVVRHPDHKYALRQLAQLLTVTEEPELARQFSLRSRQIVDYQVLLNSARERRTNVAAIKRAAELTFEMGRLWESRAWCGKAIELDRNLQWPLRLIERAESQLHVDSPQTMTDSQPAARIDLSRWPLPDWPEAASPLETNGLVAATESSLKFHDSAAEAGIDFVYFNGRNPDHEGIRMYETVGGGVASLDYDADGLPDIYFTQGTQWPVDPAQRTLLDRLYRNLGTGKFDDVTLDSMLVEPLFGQGVAIGDFDGDGFGDLFVGNIGDNRLFRNNGDGTFSDATEGSGISGSVWTSSCAFADLNGDGFADIYEVNYLKGDDVFTTVCVTQSNRGEMCAPNLFQAEQDRLYLNQQDGTFQDVSATSGIESDDGMGMGIVIANFDDTGRLGVFVANDHIYNFFFANETASRGAPLKLRECAFTKGLGLNVDGWSQACMGVAAGDVNQNGLLDLFVTNFYREPNCLYLHQPDHYFVDDTHRAGLRDSSYHVVGWGTQFLDADLDGFDDLVLTNGHVEDRTHLDRPYRMRPMFYRNTGSGRFAEVSAESLGSFFQKEQLGRGLARLDWNGDGREDFVIAHLDTPAALITNQTSGGKFFKVRLRGVDSERDAIGAVVTIECGDFKRTRQLIGGDGFQASNEKQLVFGLGDRASIDRMTVRWPTGLTQVWENLDANTEVILLEGSDELFLIDDQQDSTT